MTSPDITPYVDLTLFDRTKQEIFDELKASMLITFPALTLLEGHIEWVQLEAVAEGLWRLDQAANRIPPATFEGLVRFLGTIRDPGAGPSVPVRFDLGDTAGHTIFAGTRLRLTSTDGLVVLDLLTDADLPIAVGAAFGTTPATATTATSALNGATTGTIAAVDSLPFVDSVTLNGTITGGREQETSTAYLSRGANRISRFTSTLVQGDQFASAALDNPAVVRAHALDDFDSDLGTGVPGDHPGNVTVLLAGNAGAALSGPLKAEILADLDAQAYAPLIVHVDDSDITSVAVTSQLKRLPGAVGADVIAAAEAALTAFLNPDVWPYGRKVYRNDLIALLDQVEGVDVPLTLTLPAADVTPAGVAGLVTAGALTITTTL